MARREERTAASASSTKGEPVRFVGATLEVTAGPDAGLRARCESPSFIVGSGEAADLRLKGDKTVSREHLRLSLDEAGLRIRDDKSRNGTWLAGARIQSAMLTKDIALIVGATTIAIRLDSGPSILSVSERTEFGGAIGVSPAMRHVFAFLERAAASDVVPLFLEGDTGVGKDILARAVHAESKRANEPFVYADCGSIAPNKLEAELFGHVKQGEMLTRGGLVQQASGGTLFLDEIDQLPLELQPKVLRMLETRAILPVNARREEIVDARVIAASDRRLHEAVQASTFRKDLLQRLMVARVVIPPLRDRPEDIEPLARAFLRTATGDATSEVPSDLGVLLSAYTWPGNVRELRNVIERYALLGARDRHALFGDAAASTGETSASAWSSDLTLLPWHEARQRALASFETAYVKEVLARSNGVVARAAEYAGVARPSFYRMMERQKPGSSEKDDD